MPAVRIAITTTEYLSASFSWYEIFASQTNWALGSVVANAEFTELAFATSFIHPNLLEGDTWFYWVRAAYDQGASYSALRALGSVTIDVAILSSGGGSISENQATDKFTFIFDGAGLPVAVGADDLAFCASDCIATAWVIFGDTNGNAAFDLQVDSIANYPPTGADSIVAAAPPTCTGTNVATSSTLTGWDITIPADSFVRAVVTDLTLMTKVRLVVIVLKL